ncbi:MAG: hypothetical protein JWN30_1411 [Bacilli bacterium]|nr:hypothetical protein [Bacilli bacterium]
MSHFLSLFNHPTEAIRNILHSPAHTSRRWFHLVAGYLVIVLYLNQLLFHTGPITIRAVLTGFLLAVGIALSLWISQYLWTLLVRFGLLIVASNTLQESKSVRRERYAKLKSMYPYLLAITTLPTIFTLFLPSLNQPASSAHMFTGYAFDTLFLLLALALQIYRWACSVMTVKLIYRVSTAQALFGPLLAAFIVWLAAALAAGIVVVVLRLI